MSARNLLKAAAVSRTSALLCRDSRIRLKAGQPSFMRARRERAVMGTPSQEVIPAGTEAPRKAMKWAGWSRSATVPHPPEMPGLMNHEETRILMAGPQLDLLRTDSNADAVSAAQLLQVSPSSFRMTVGSSGVRLRRWRTFSMASAADSGTPVSKGS
ncbi:MAG: hypothetical protein BWX47_02158 [candidate division Hyd24-12 bacterium ADurb.Bin004]|nr:MAG: hypothetical protein BWX47_02158 [candidate division Hyd24-12 bacterium ADurb.Bin004]